MKTKAIFFSAMALLAIACTKENIQEDNKIQGSDVNYVPFEISATVESKTILGEDGKAVKWESGDKISVLNVDTEAEIFNSDFSLLDAETGTFSGLIPEGATELYAIYPYREATLFDRTTKTATSKLFPEQIARQSSFAINTAQMAAVVDTDTKTIALKNLCSHIRFILPSSKTDVKSITLVGNNGEVLTGLYTISFETGAPVVTVTNPEIYVTLRNAEKEDGSVEPLAPGEYYFTTFPVEFTKGFTVILSKTDGTQEAISTGNALILEKNVILQMAEAPAEKYTDHMNYFVKYNDGFEISFGGQTISKDNYPKAYFTKDITIGQDGLYFIHSNGKANINYNTASNLVVIGSDKSSRSTITLSKSIQPADNGTLVLYANLNCVTEKRIIEQKNFKSFGSFIISNCNYQITNRYGLLFNAKDSKIESVVIEDSNFGIETAGTKTDMYFINCGNMTSTINNLQVSNSILYSMNQNTTKIVDFRLIHAPNTTFENTDISNNTFVGLKTRIPTGTKSGLIYANCFNSKTILKYNYMVECQVTGISSDNMIYLIYATKVGETFTRDFQHNYVYSSINERTMTFSDCFKIDGNAPQGVRKMTDSPLNSKWDPAKGIYGPYNQVTYGTGTVPTSVGAQRPDMVTEANTASYRYAPNELGSF